MFSTIYQRLASGPPGGRTEIWNGIVYPARPPGFHEAAYLAEFFDVIEINSTFYRPPDVKIARDSVRRIADKQNFVFTAKLWRRFTHERNAGQEGQEDIKEFREGPAPLAEAARLGPCSCSSPGHSSSRRRAANTS